MKNRIGYCVLHPDDIAEQHHTAGCNMSDGSTEDGFCPACSSASASAAVRRHGRAWRTRSVPGVWAELAFEGGSVFEMEDQRNWTDASYKTFSTPLRLPYPVELACGTRIRQSVTLSLAASAGRRGRAGGGRRRLLHRRPRRPGHPLPPIGLGVASHGATADRNGTCAPGCRWRPRTSTWTSRSPTRIWAAATAGRREAERLDAPRSRTDRRPVITRPMNRPYAPRPMPFKPRVVRWLVFPAGALHRRQSLREVLEAGRRSSPRSRRRGDLRHEHRLHLSGAQLAAPGVDQRADLRRHRGGARLR